MSFCGLDTVIALLNLVFEIVGMAADIADIAALALIIYLESKK